MTEVLDKLSRVSDEVTFWSDPSKRETVSLLQVRAQQAEDLVERCRSTMALLYDAMFPLNRVPIGIASLLEKFGHGQEVSDVVRAQVAAGAELALALVRSRYRDVDFSVVAMGPLPECRSVTVMEGHYEAVRDPADKIAELLIRRSEECKSHMDDRLGHPKGKGKTRRKHKKGHD